MRWQHCRGIAALQAVVLHALSSLSKACTGMQVFHAGTAADQDGQTVSAGGRVLSITAVGECVAKAQHQAYQVIC